VRHGETDWNRQKRVQGKRDIPLNSHGNSQAKALAKALNKLRPQAIYASPLSRAFVTAEIIAAEHGISPKPVVALAELDHGLWEGLTIEQVRADFPEQLALWLTQPQLLELPQGESLELLLKRALPALGEIRSQHQAGETVIVVAHEAVNRTLLCHFLGWDLASFRSVKQENSAVNLIRFYAEHSCVSLLNDTCHLKQAFHK